MTRDFFNSMRLLEGRKNMHMWQAVVGIHELVTAFKTVKEETLFEELKVLPAGAVYKVLWLSRSTSQSALPAWLICFGEASALRSVSGHKGPAKQLDGSSGYTVRILNGFSEMKGSVHLTEIKLFVLSFKQPTYAVENLQRKSQTLWVVIAVRFSFLIHIFRSCSTSYQV